MNRRGSRSEQDDAVAVKVMSVLQAGEFRLDPA